MYCQPCDNQKIKNLATVWCLVCDEPLCEPCNTYHKALKVTKDHRTINCDDYREISDFLSLVQTQCEKHPEQSVEYYCQIHETVFCVSCRRSEHDNCPGVGTIEEHKSIDDLYSNLETCSEQIKQRISVLNVLHENKRENIKKLKSQSEVVLEDLNEKRKQINSALDKFESETKTKFETNFQSEKTKIQNDLTILEQTQEKWKKEQDQLSKIIQLKPLTSVQLLLAKEHIQKQKLTNEDKIKKLSDEFFETSCECQISVNISKSNRSIKICDKMDVTYSKSKLNEAEDEKLSCHESGSDFEVSEMSTYTDKTSSLKTNHSTIRKSPAKGTDCETSLKRETTVTDAKSKQETTDLTYKFKYSKYFTAMKQKPQIEVSCIKLLANGRVVLGEVSQPRLLIYNMSASLFGTIGLQYRPESIATIDDVRIAVTMSNILVIVNIVKFSVEKFHFQFDDCFGVTCLRQNVFVNCANTGIRVLDKFGYQLEPLSSLTGILYVANIKPDTLVYIRKGNKTVHFLNTVTDVQDENICPHLGQVSGITADDNKNVYMSCKATNRIFMLKSGSHKWEIILTSTDRIDHPLSLDFYKDTLYVVNRNKEVHSYERIVLQRAVSTAV